MEFSKKCATVREHETPRKELRFSDLGILKEKLISENNNTVILNKRTPSLFVNSINGNTNDKKSLISTNEVNTFRPPHELSVMSSFSENSSECYSSSNIANSNIDYPLFSPSEALSTSLIHIMCSVNSFS